MLCYVKMIAKLERTQSYASTKNPCKQWEVHPTTNEQEQNRRLRKDVSPSHREWGVNTFYGRQIFALDSVDIKAQNM